MLENIRSLFNFRSILAASLASFAAALAGLYGFPQVFAAAAEGRSGLTTGAIFGAASLALLAFAALMLAWLFH